MAASTTIKAGLAALAEARPYIRTILALIIYLRWGKQPMDKTYCYAEADAFLETLTKDLKQSAERG